MGHLLEYMLSYDTIKVDYITSLVFIEILGAFL